MDSNPKIPQNKILIILTEMGITRVSEYSLSAKPNLSVNGVNKDSVSLLNRLVNGNMNLSNFFIKQK